MLITRLSKADKKNRRGRSPSICRIQWEPFWSGFLNVNVNGFVPVTLNLWPICDICDGHKLSQIRICDRIYFSVFIWVLLSKTGLVTFWSQMVTFSDVTGTNLFMFTFSRKWFRTKRNPGKHNRMWLLFIFYVWNPDQNGSDLRESNCESEISWEIPPRYWKIFSKDRNNFREESFSQNFIDNQSPLYITQIWINKCQIGNTLVWTL